VGLMHTIAMPRACMYIELMAGTAVAASSRGAYRSGPELTPTLSLSLTHSISSTQPLAILPAYHYIRKLINFSRVMQSPTRGVNNDNLSQAVQRKK
jgi:hypothetical protein